MTTTRHAKSVAFRAVQSLIESSDEFVGPVLLAESGREVIINMSLYEACDKFFAQMKVKGFMHIRTEVQDERRQRIDMHYAKPTVSMLRSSEKPSAEQRVAQPAV